MFSCNQSSEIRDHPSAPNECTWNSHVPFERVRGTISSFLNWTLELLMASNHTNLTNSARKRLSGGFSLIELMTVVALVAVFLTLAAPSLSDMIQRNRVTSEVNTFLADLKFARSVAMKRGQSVTVCPSSNGLTCLANNNWHSGWIIFNDVDGSGSVDSGDVLVRYRQGFSGGDTFVGPSALVAVTFGRLGMASNLAAGPFTLVAATSPANDASTQCVVLNQVGHQTLQSVEGGCDVSTQ